MTYKVCLHPAMPEGEPFPTVMDGFAPPEETAHATSYPPLQPRRGAGAVSPCGSVEKGAPGPPTQEGPLALVLDRRRLGSARLRLVYRRHPGTALCRLTRRLRRQPPARPPTRRDFCWFPRRPDPDAHACPPRLGRRRPRPDPRPLRRSTSRQRLDDLWLRRFTRGV